MQFSYEWLSRYVDMGADLEETARGLTDIGLAVELIQEVGEDRVLDLDITTNRPDCMNHLGLAREVAALRGVELNLPPCELPPSEPEWEGDLVTIEVPELCRRFASQLIEGVTVKPSPPWLQRRLEAIGLRPISNIVDITNYVLWETGQPLHAFDFDTLAGSRLNVRTAREGESIQTLDGERRSLDASMVVVADAERAVGLAGIMGGQDTEVSESSQRILLEGAWWEPSSVRRTARVLGMHTDASHRFERATDIDGCRRAIERAAALVLELAGGRLVGGPIDTWGTPLPPMDRIELSHPRLERFAGIEIPPAEVAQRLSALGFDLEETEVGWSVLPPSWRRFDVVEAADLYEEVLRTIGFDRIPAVLPPSDGPDAPEIPGHALRRRVRNHLAAAGFAEVINYAFYGTPEDALVEPLIESTAPMELQNPLSDRYRWMRRNLLAGVVENANFNRRRNLEAVRLFETGHVFWHDAAGGFHEREHLAVVLGGTLGTPWERQHSLDVFDLKGVLESLLDACGVALEVRPTSRSGLLPGIAAELLVADEVVGFLGELDEPAEEGTYPLFVAELSLEALLPLPGPPTVRVPPRHPGIAVDFTLTHPVEIPFADIVAAIEASDTPDLIGCELVDRYRGRGVPEGSVNTTIHFEYNAADRSLTQEEVNERQTQLTGRLENRFGTVP